jgi:hypothetical protein
MTDLDSLLDRIEEKQKVEGQIQLSTNGTSLDFLQAIYRDPNQPVQRRMRAASAALPFEHPKLAVIARVREEDLAERLMRALQASGKVINARPMQVIEPPKPLQVSEADEAPDHSGPFAQNSKHRWRRF